MSRKAIQTGVGPTALVAIEQHYPKSQRIIEDDLSYRVLPLGMRSFVWLVWPNWIRDWMVRATERDAPGLWAGTMCRKRFIIERIRESLNQIKDIVNLGSGFETGIYRFSPIPVWELDQSENIELKRARLQWLFGTVPASVRLISIDFDRENVATVLTSNGYSTANPTFFVWEAVTQYLTETGIRTIFEFLSGAERGSRLVFTYFREDFLSGRSKYGWDKRYKKYVKKDKLWLFAMDPEAWPAFLRVYGWNVLEHCGYEELSERYVRPTGRELASTPIERIIYAEKL
ncbi:MAG: SAM-dependent methyltransferase [Bacteroidota bacterium]